MNSDINIRNSKSLNIKDKNRQKLFFYIKFYLNTIKIQRTFRKFKVKPIRNIINENDLPKNVN